SRRSSLFPSSPSSESRTPATFSVRGLHRLFAEDPAGSVSRFLWQRRLIRCADALRDPSRAHLTITDVCFSYGFSSSSHFSRLFKDRYGIAPARYRIELACPIRVIRDQC